jgi:hypothetical protein
MGGHLTVKHALLANILLSVLFASTAAAAGQAIGGASQASLSDEDAGISAAYLSSAAGAMPAAHRRSVLQASSSVIPAEVNQTAITVRNTFNNATTEVRDRFTNASADLTQLGQTSALDTARQSGNASVGDYANAFVNDTNRALGALGSVFKSSSEQSILSQAFVILSATTAIMLGLMG